LETAYKQVKNEVVDGNEKTLKKKSKRLRKDVSVYMYEFGNIKKDKLPVYPNYMCHRWMLINDRI
jgi:hypothetical protein